MRTGKIPVNNVSGGEVTSAPLLETPQKYSRLLQNFYINSEGHIKKVPGFSAASQQISNVRILTGIDFKKSDGTSIILAGGLRDGALNTVSAAFTASSTMPPTVFSGTGVDDILYSGAYSGAKPALYEIEVTQQGTGYDPGPPPTWDGDVYRWRKDGGAWNFVFGDVAQPQNIPLSDGISVDTLTGAGHTVGDKWTLTITDDLDDLTPSGTYSGSGASTFDVEIDAEGTPDTFKWRQDGGAYTTGVAITGAAQLLADGVSVTFAATTGHSFASSWAVIATTYSGAIYRKYGDLLSPIKDNFASTNPIYMSQIGDIVVCSNNSDRPVAYDGVTFTNVNMPFGNSVELVGTGLNDFIAAVTFTYEDATYEVIVDGVATMTVLPTFAGTGINDMDVPDPNFSGDAATATFEVQIDATGSGDTFKYNVNGGPFLEDNALSTGAAGTMIGAVVHLKASATVGHNSEDVYEFQVVSNGTPDKFKWRKNGGAWSADINCPAYPTYQALDVDYSISFVSATGNTVDDVFSFQVDGATNPDTYQWRKDGGAWTTGVDVANVATELSDDIFVKFKYFTGHTLNDAWSMDVARDTVKYRKVGDAYTTGELITGALQTIVAGVQFKFNAINGHTLNDKWTIPISQNVRIGKTYPYKNRLWGIGNDKLTAYYSDLRLPTDFIGAGAGYIDFRYVIPEGDEMLDINSILNYLAFFFRNHIVIYSGSDPTASGDFAVYQVLSGVGVVAPETVVSVGSDVFFLTDKGVKGLKQVINAGALNVSNVSAAIDQDIVDAIKANSSGVYDSAHYPKYGLVLFLIGTTIFVFNYRQSAWSRIILPTANDASKVLSMFSDSEGNLYMGGYDYLFRFDPAAATFNFNGQAPEYKWKTGLFQVTTADSLYFTELLLRLASFSAVTLTVKARAVGYDTEYEDQSAFNEQTIQIDAKTPSDIITNFARAPLFGAGKYIQLEITETPAYTDNNDVEIIGMEISGEIGSII